MDNLENYSDMLPEGTVPMFGVRILAYYDEDGQMAYKFSSEETGNTPITSLIGLLEMVKIDIANNATQLGRKKFNKDD